MSNVTEPRRRRGAATPPRRTRTPTAARSRNPTGASRHRPSPRVRRRRALLTTTLLGLAIVGLLFAFIYPTRTWLDQRSQINAAHQRIANLQHDTARLQTQSQQLQGDAQVERLAREQYGLVRPGETPYVLVPAGPATPVTAAPAGPPPTTLTTTAKAAPPHS